MNDLQLDGSNTAWPFGKAEIVAKVCDAAFGKPLITNVLRAQIVEAMVAIALEPEWHWCGADYAPCDFERSDGMRLEVKQSAARQTWITAKPSKPIFDIAARTGRNETNGWVEDFGRAAHMYVFAHHNIFDDSADHRDAEQWSFYIVPTCHLPDVKQISLASIKPLSTFVTISELAEAIDTSSKSIGHRP